MKADLLNWKFHPYQSRQQLMNLRFYITIYIALSEFEPMYKEKTTVHKKHGGIQQINTERQQSQLP